MFRKRHPIHTSTNWLVMPLVRLLRQLELEDAEAAFYWVPKGAICWQYFISVSLLDARLCTDALYINTASLRSQAVRRTCSNWVGKRFFVMVSF